MDMAKLPGSWFSWFILTLIIITIIPYTSSIIPEAPEISALNYLITLLASALLLLIVMGKASRDPLISPRADILVLFYGIYLGIVIGAMALFSPLQVKVKTFILATTVIVEVALIFPTLISVVKGILKYGIKDLITSLYPVLLAVIVIIICIGLLRVFGITSPMALSASTILLLASIIIITSIEYLKKK